MQDIEIKILFKNIKESGMIIPDPLNKLIKSLKYWHRKTGGLSSKQIELLKSIEEQVTVKNSENNARI